MLSAPRHHPFEEGPTMTTLVLQLPSHASDGPCPLCGRPAGAGDGPRLCAADSHQPVCRSCGKKHAPALAALAELAHTADRVGRIGRHTVFPPLAALLDLAHAAENYTAAHQPRRRQAV